MSDRKPEVLFYRLSPEHPQQCSFYRSDVGFGTLRILPKNKESSQGVVSVEFLDLDLPDGIEPSKPFGDNPKSLHLINEPAAGAVFVNKAARLMN